MLLLTVKVFGVMVLHSVMKLVLRMSLVVVMMMTVLVLPRHFLMMTGHRTVKVLERMGLVMMMAAPLPAASTVVVGLPPRRNILKVLVADAHCGKPK